MKRDELQSATILDWIRLIFNRRWRRTVTGDSMLPLLHDKDVVLINPRAYVKRSPQIGDVVIAKHPFQTDVTLIKRITRIDENGRFYLNGDNPKQSSDSRSFGSVPQTHILGQVVRRL